MNRIFAAFGVFFALVTLAFGQAENPAEKGPGLPDGYRFGPAWGVRIVPSLENMAATQATLASEFNFRAACGGSLDFTFQPAEKIELRFSLAVADKGALIAAAALPPGVFQDSSATTIDTKLASWWAMARPGIGWNLTAGKTRVILMGHLAIGRLLSQKIKAEGNPWQPLDLFNSFYFGAGAGMEIRRQISGKLWWTAGPGIEWQLNEAFQSSLFRPQLYSLFIGTGILFNHWKPRHAD